jgi:hypothetical protein
MNKLIPNNNPKVLNVGPDNIVHAKPFNTKPTTIEQIDKIIPFCFVIILSFFKNTSFHIVNFYSSTTFHLNSKPCFSINFSQ